MASTWLDCGTEMETGTLYPVEVSDADRVIEPTVIDVEAESSWPEALSVTLIGMLVGNVDVPAAAGAWRCS